MAERVGAACAGGLHVELLQDVDREGDVPGSEDVVGAGGLVLLAVEPVACAEALDLALDLLLLDLEPGELGCP
jgi:hypothetical protein